ncbi:cation:dicarboxylate symporter family transporter [Paraburkholderia sp. ZP32-5]|uniref:cation:dicarboxylate symporter family transporter n=1 Tax=Paraburkholderia sp. ZP32-5 TaxID=2883245 RepID=UPI001F18AC56|nr:cation:dicarboxylase symporter family transporter [Paraburkholderia sp. ZP32-5]
MRFLKQLHIQVLLGLAAGIVLALCAPATAIAMKPLGDGFIALLRMLMAPIVFCTVIHGLSHARDLRKLGMLGVKTLVYFEVVSTLGLALGLVAVNLFKPGLGLHAINLSTASGDKISQFAASASHMNVTQFFMDIIPRTMVGAFSTGDMLQVLLVTLLVGVALMMTVGPDSLLLRGIEESQRVLFKVLSFVMRLAPLGAFGAMAFAVGSYGGATLLYLLKVVAVYWGASVLFVVVVLGGIMSWSGVSLWSLLSLIKEEILLVFGTASGEVAFPRLVEKLKEAGCDEMVVGFVLPAGYAFNLDGTSIYMAISVGFIAQATDTPFSLGQQLAVLAVLMLTSKGGAMVAGGAFIKLAATMESVKALPLNGLGLLFGIDRPMATATAVTNMIGNAVAVVTLSKVEQGLDTERFRERVKAGHAIGVRAEPAELAIPDSLPK